ncbi:MAG TPA: GAF domain-containing SpoIIE family protein phosphatase [Bacteroidota bacterium]|nr:GAF domain-containing SpoIIE family protein phosphatase [Bacteroidota bacterium]
MLKFRRFLYLSGAFLLLLVKFAVDIIRMNVEMEMGGLMFLRELAAAGAFFLMFLTLQASVPGHAVNPARRLGVLLVITAVFMIGAGLLALLPADGFDAKELTLLPLDYSSLFLASLLGLLAGIFALVALRFLRDLVLMYQKKSTVRNFQIFVILLLATAVSSLLIRPLESSVMTSVLFALTLVLAVVNIFRMPWIVYQTKREKILTLVFSFFLFLLFTVGNILLSQNDLLSRGLLYYSRPVQEAVSLSIWFGNLFCGMVFTTTLFHLPTAGAFDRKRSEVASIHTLSKLVTQVFDFEKLTESVTSMTLQVVEAQSCWLELLPAVEEGKGGETHLLPAWHTQIVGMKNITRSEIEDLLGTGLQYLRSAVYRDRKPIVVDAVAKDPRFAVGPRGATRPGSLVIVPLVSHVGPIGFLYATKESQYGFVKDDVELISTFADQATVAIENSRLIKKALERERLVQEMTLAQEMQRKLLPQELPAIRGVDIDAISTPAFEVGGDYYDFVQLSETTVGIIVGDVSGKGVPAAFYMSEVKGIFQSLSALYASPREFMVRANVVLSESIDKHSFVSLLYGILDVRTGRFQIARAGHCPLLHVGRSGSAYLRPDGMGLGLAEDSFFSETIEEHTLQLAPGDVCVFYTDGVTEAHRNDEEFGYDRLRAAAGLVDGKSAARIKDEILRAVGAFIQNDAPHDDMTLVVVRWLGLQA